MIQIEVAWRCPRHRDRSGSLLAAARGALRALGFRRGELSIAVIGSREIARLHRSFCGVAGVTDVITFPLGQCQPPVIDGEIVLCADVARRIAGADAFESEMILYLVHGLLHLAGYQDSTAADFAALHKREDQILKRLGVPAAGVAAARPAAVSGRINTPKRTGKKPK